MDCCNKEKIDIEQLIESRKLSEAKEQLIEFKLKYKDNISSASLEALICIFESEYEKAKSILLEAYNNEKIDYNILYKLGMVSELLGDSSAAIKYYSEAKIATEDNVNLAIIDHMIEDLIKSNYPKVIIIETIRGCNLECIFCPLQVDVKTKKHGLMTDKTFNNIMKTVISVQKIKRFIMHNLGEPLLDKNIFKKIRKIKDVRKNCDVIVDSNLSIDFDASELVKSGLDILDIALDGASQSSYSKYRKNGSLDKVISNTVRIATAKKIAKSQKPVINAKTVIFKHLVNELDLISYLAAQAGADNYLLQTAVFREEANEEPQEWIPEQQQLSRYNVEKLYKQKEIVYYENLISQEKYCSGILEDIPPVIDFEGNVYPCCYNCTDEKYNMGNINKMSFKEIWESEKYVTFRSDVIKDRFKYDICRTCYRPS